MYYFSFRHVNHSQQETALYRNQAQILDHFQIETEYSTIPSTTCKFWKYSFLNIFDN